MPREHAARHGLDVARAEAGEGDEDEERDGGGLGDADVEDQEERRDDQERQGAQVAPGLERHEEVVRERRGGGEQRAVEVRGGRAPRPQRRVVGRDRREPGRHGGLFCCHARFDRSTVAVAWVRDEMEVQPRDVSANHILTRQSWFLCWLNC